MTAANPDPFDTSALKKSAEDSGRGSVPIDGLEIDAMLDRMDCVLSGDLDKKVPPFMAATSRQAELVILSRLRDLAEDLARLRSLADDSGDPEVAVFARETRARIERFVCRKRTVDPVLSGTIEVEMDYERLHEFMLDPDLDRIAG